MKVFTTGKFPVRNGQPCATYRTPFDLYRIVSFDNITANKLGKHC